MTDQTHWCSFAYIVHKLTVYRVLADLPGIALEISMERESVFVEYIVERYWMGVLLALLRHTVYDHISDPPELALWGAYSGTNTSYFGS